MKILRITYFTIIPFRKNCHDAILQQMLYIGFLQYFALLRGHVIATKRHTQARIKPLFYYRVKR